MTHFSPIFVSDVTAAKLLDIPLAKFREFVDLGYFPPPRMIAPNTPRWDYEFLKTYVSGNAADGMGHVKW